jgi:YVTN family beta-propeller protein
MPVRRTAVATLLCLAASAGVSWAQYWEASIPTGQEPIEVIWNPTANKVYTANLVGGTVTVIDGATNQVRATLPVGPYPGGLSCNPKTNKVYVCCFGDEPSDYIVAVIDGSGDSVLKRLQLEFSPSLSVVNDSMNKVYVRCDEPHQNIVVLDGAADTVLRYIPARFSGDMLVHPASNRLFFFADLDFADTIKALDCRTDEVVLRLPITTGRPNFSTWSRNPVTDLVYLGGRGGTGRTYVLTPEGDSVVASTSGASEIFCAVPFPNKMYTRPDWDWLWVVDGSTHVVTDTVAIQGGPMVCDTVRGKVYTCQYSPEMVSVVDARADTLLMSLSLPGWGSIDLCWNQANSRVYVVQEMANLVQVIRDTSSAIAEPATVHEALGSRAATLAGASYLWPGRETGQVIDACGKGVREVWPGANDLSLLPAGVYVVVGAVTGATTKFVKLR